MVSAMNRTMLLILWLALVLTACAGIVGIEDASLDPQLSAGGAGGQGGGEPPTTCEIYCSTLMKSCTGDHQVYISETACLETCKALPEGRADDPTGNTVACRLNEALKVEPTGEPEVHCPPAGPGGDGVCGENCDAYCTLLDAFCKDQQGFPTNLKGDCNNACGNVPTLCTGKFSTNEKDGDTIECRIYHLGASATDPLTHCPHAFGVEICTAPGSGGMGGSP